MATIGIEWINKYHGRAKDLKNRHNCARGFYNELSGVRQFEYGNDWAWDQDFEQSGVGAPSTGTDSFYADKVDIVYFAGHGSSTGPFFGRADKDDGTAKYSEIQLGDKSCNWIIFDACSVLAYDGGSVFTRWKRTFKGLHYILGFGSTAYDRDDRGKKFAKYLNAGYTVRNAWKKACQETEGSGVTWAYLRADKVGGGTDTYNDHWYGKGFVSADPTGSLIFYWGHGTC
jgi:hypothetical protein